MKIEHINIMYLHNSHKGDVDEEADVDSSIHIQSHTISLFQYLHQYIQNIHCFGPCLKKEFLFPQNGNFAGTFFYRKH